MAAVLGTVGACQRRLDPPRPKDPIVPTSSAAGLTASPPTPTQDPNPPRPGEQFQTLQANGCRLSAPATWSIQPEAMKTGAKLVIASLTGISSVGIRYEPASGTKLTKQDIDALMEKASRMPLKLEDSQWSMVDKHDAWREVRTGAMGGSQRLWIRYSYRENSALVQLIGSASGTPSREERELLETILQSSHCDP